MKRARSKAETSGEAVYRDFDMASSTEKPQILLFLLYRPSLQVSLQFSENRTAWSTAGCYSLMPGRPTLPSLWLGGPELEAHLEQGIDQATRVRPTFARRRKSRG